MLAGEGVEGAFITYAVEINEGTRQCVLDLAG
jgi:hypothetical protein